MVIKRGTKKKAKEESSLTELEISFEFLHEITVCFRVLRPDSPRAGLLKLERRSRTEVDKLHMFMGL